MVMAVGLLKLQTKPCAPVQAPTISADFGKKGTAATHSG